MPMDGDVVLCMVGNTNDDVVSLAGFDGWAWELAVHRQDILGVTEPSIGSFFYLQQLGNHHKLWETYSNLIMRPPILYLFAGKCEIEILYRRMEVCAIFPWGSFIQDRAADKTLDGKKYM